MAGPTKPLAFFIHFNKPASRKAHEARWSVHQNGRCLIVKDVSILVPVHTKYRKTQPICVLKGIGYVGLSYDFSRALISPNPPKPPYRALSDKHPPKHEEEHAIFRHENPRKKVRKYKKRGPYKKTRDRIAAGIIKRPRTKTKVELPPVPLETVLPL